MNSLENKKSTKVEFKLKPFLAWLAVFLLLSYLYALFLGERSIFVYIDDKKRLQELQKEYNTLQDQNQRLQKRYFELIQLTPDEDAF
jgi:cell division protein FtsB